jgi:hypothetical protein
MQLAKATFLILSKQLAPALLILRKVSSFLSLLMKVPSVFTLFFLIINVGKSHAVKYKSGIVYRRRFSILFGGFFFITRA